MKHLRRRLRPLRSKSPNLISCLRRLCTRFHLVARQLRLRNEYRPTLEIEDEEDLQDLFYALLRLQFDEVESRNGRPYAEGKRRASYLLDRERTMIVVKKTLWTHARAQPGGSAEDGPDTLRGTR
ncbi:MAG: hypothetical protein U0231_11735 [Nitrospiraceae bacterium]